MPQDSTDICQLAKKWPARAKAERIAPSHHEDGDRKAEATEDSMMGEDNDMMKRKKTELVYACLTLTFHRPYRPVTSYPVAYINVYGMQHDFQSSVCAYGRSS